MAQASPSPCLWGAFHQNLPLDGKPSFELLPRTADYVRLEQPHRVIMEAKCFLLGGVGRLVPLLVPVPSPSTTERNTQVILGMNAPGPGRHLLHARASGITRRNRYHTGGWDPSPPAQCGPKTSLRTVTNVANATPRGIDNFPIRRENSCAALLNVSTNIFVTPSSCKRGISITYAHSAMFNCIWIRKTPTLSALPETARGSFTRARALAKPTVRNASY